MLETNDNQKYLLVEGAYGLTEKVPIVTNPYASGRLSKKADDKDGMKKMRELVSRKTHRDSKGWLWTMGYNNCVGRYSGGMDFPRFSGSSLNRTKKKANGQDLHTVTRHLVEMASAIAKKMSGIPEWALQGAFRNMVLCSDQDSKEKYILWIRLQVLRDVDGLSFNIHSFSSRSRGKVKDKATAFFRSSPGSRVFVTLTFIAPVDDRTGVAILNKFLTVVRKEHSNVQFLWVAERQTENPDTPDNIHFHMIINKRLPVRRYNALWVLQQYNAGLIGKDKYGQVISAAEITQRVEAGTVGKVFNPFDVKRIQSIAGLSAYLTKYITKQEKDVPFGCAVWHCSRGVSRLFTKSVVSPSAFRYCLSLNNCLVDKKTGECFEATPLRGQFFVMVYVNNKAAPLSYLREMEQINKWMLAGLSPSDMPTLNDGSYTKYYLKN